LRLHSRAKVAVRGALHRAGFDLVRSLDASDLLRRRVRLLEQHGVNVLFDVGANAGQYALTMRALGYGGRIVSFEPSTDAFELLARTAQADGQWETVNCGLGAEAGERTLHVSANSQSSSLLVMLPAHLAAAPDSAYVRDETVTLSTLAAEMERRVGADDRLFVKIDTQGSERDILAGAGPYLDGIVGWQVELSLVPLYEDQPLIEELIALLRDLGYVPMSIEPDFSDPTTGRLLQADGVFFRGGGSPTGPSLPS
jgi:FkbM family methyltransferase